MTKAKSILQTNPTPAQADRYRREVRSFVEALAAGRLDERMVGEIEAAFADLGRVVDLDFEEVRRVVERDYEEVRGEVGGKTVVPVPTIRPGRPSPRSRTARLARLPDVFTWREVAEVWEVPKRTAFKRIKNLLAEGAIEKLGHGRYEVFAVETAESAESAASAKRRERRESAESAPPTFGDAYNCMTARP